MQTPTAEIWQGFAASRRRVVVLRGGGWRAWLAAGLMYGLAALIAVILLPLLVLLVLAGLVLATIGNLRRALSRRTASGSMKHDDEGRSNVRVLGRDND